MFRVLERPQFSAVQTELFPIYFSMQTAIPVLLALTYPGSKNPFGPPSSIQGVFDKSNRWSVLVPLSAMLATGLLNLSVLLPATARCKEERRMQEQKDGKNSSDPPPHSKEMQALNKQFAKLHGMSSMLNLATFVASVIYGVALSSRLN